MKLSDLNNYKGEANFALANIIASCISMLTGVIAAIYIDPEELGVIQTVLLVATYTSFLGLGIGSGLNRNLAYYKAKGDFVTVQDQVNTAYRFSYLNAAISLLIGIVCFFYYLLNGFKPIYLLSCILLIANLVLNPLINTIEVTYKSGQEFGKLGNIKNIQSVVYIVTAFLPAIIGALGRIVSGSIYLIVGYALRLYNPPYICKGKGSIKAFKDLLYTGLPLLVSSYIWSVSSVMDKTYIAANMSPREVGLFTVSGYIMTLFMMIPSSICVLLYPKAAAIYGSTGKKDALLGFWRKSIILMAFVLLPIIVIAFFLLPYVVGFVMPKYVEGIGAARITLLTCATFIYFGPSSLFGTLKKNNLYIAVQVVLLASFWIVVTAFSSCFNTLESVAWLRFVLSFIQMFFVIFYSRSLLIGTNRVEPKETDATLD